MNRKQIPAVIGIEKIRFYFEYIPSGEYSNDLVVQCGNISHSLRTWSHINIELRSDWLTDEICDRIGKQLASDRSNWLQFVEA